MENLCLRFLRFSRNKQSQKILDIQKWLKQQLIHLKQRLHFVDIMSTRILHDLMQRKAMKYKLRSKQINIKSELILMYVQYALKANILMSRKQLGISQEKFINIYISSLRKKKAGSLERLFLLSIGHHQYRQESWKSH